MPTWLSKIFKVVAWTLLGVVLLLIAICAALPSYLSTESGLQRGVSLVNHFIPGTLSIKKADFNWFGGQKIDHYSLRDAAGNDVLSFEHFSTEANLLPLLIGHYNLGETTLTSPSLHLVKEENGESNLDRALSKKKKTKPKEKRKTWALPKVTGEIRVTDGTVTLDAPHLEPVTLSDLTLDYSPTVFHLVGKTKQGALEGALMVSGKDGLIRAEITDFPVTALDQWEGTTLFSSAIGRTLSLNFELQTEENVHAEGSVSSQNLTGEFQGETSDGIFVLTPGSHLQLTVTPAFFAAVVEDKEWHLAEKFDLSLAIERLEVPLSLNTPDYRQIPFSGKLSIGKAQVSHDKAGTLSLSDFTATLVTNENLEASYEGVIQGASAPSHICGKFSLSPESVLDYNLTAKAFPSQLFELFLDDAELVVPLFGPQFDATLTGTYDKGAIDALFQLLTPKMSVEGSLQGDTPETLKMRLAGQLSLSEAHSAALGPSPQISATADLSFKNQNLSVPLVEAKLSNPNWDLDLRGKLGENGKPFSWDQVHLIASGSMHQFPLSEGLEEQPSETEGLLYLQLDGAQNLLTGKLKILNQIASFEETRFLKITFDVKNFVQNGRLDLPSAQVNAKGELSHFPVAFFNPFFGEDISLTPFFGPTVDLTFEAEKDPEWSIDLYAKATGFQADLSLSFDEGFNVIENRPAYIHWEMTPVRYLALIHLLYPEQEVGFVLTEPASVHLRMSEFTCPTKTPKSLSPFLCQSGFVGDLEIGTLHFMNHTTEEKVTLEEVSGSIKGEDFTRTIELGLDGRIVADNIPKGERSGFRLDGKLIHAWTPEGKFNREGLAFEEDLQLNLIPVSQITGIIPMDAETREILRAALGPLVNARIYGKITHMEGPLTVDIKSTNFKGIFPIELQKDHLVLRKAVEAELTLTEEVNRTLLKDINPLLIAGAWSEHPIRLYLNAEGFSIPISPYSLREVKIGSGIIDLGKLTVKNGGDIQELMDFLKAKQVSPEGYMQAWFTPLYFSFDGGTMRYQRVDALLGGNVHIAMWGRIDLIKDKVKMTLGISPETLKERFGLTGLPSKDMFQIKMRGSTSNVELDWGAASTRLGIIITRSSGGHLGYLVGGLLEQIIKLFGEEPAPPPTTKPFPWQQS